MYKTLQAFQTRKNGYLISFKPLHYLFTQSLASIYPQEEKKVTFNIKYA